MAEIRFGHRRRSLFILLSGGLLFGVAFSILLNLSTTLSKEEAEKRVRAVLSREITQTYVSVVKNKQVGRSDADSNRQLEKKFLRVNNLALFRLM